MIKKNVLWLALLTIITGSFSSCRLFRTAAVSDAEVTEEQPLEHADEAYFDDDVEGERSLTPVCDAISAALEGYPHFLNLMEDDGEVDEWNSNIIHYESTLEVDGMEDLITEFVDDDRRMFVVRNNDIGTKAEADKLYNKILSELEACVLFDPISKMTEDRSNGKLYDVLTVFSSASGQPPFVRLNVGKNFGMDGYHVIVLVRDTK